jgi:heptosyltransferase-2
MGDVILASPVLTFLKQKYPDSNLCFLTYKKYGDFFRDDPRLMSVTGIVSISDYNKLNTLQKIKFDLIVDLQNNRKSNLIRSRYFSNIKTGKFKKFYLKRILLLFFRLNFYDIRDNVVRRYMKATYLTVNNTDKLPPVSLSFKSAFTGNDILPESFSKLKPAIALMPFSAWKNKKWPSLYYIKIGQYFQKKNWNILLFGGPDEQLESEKIQNEIGESCYNLTGKISLYIAGLILKQCSLALGNDTGLVHLARSCNVRTGVIYGSTTSHFGFFPYGKPHYKVFQSNELCRPCNPHGGNICFRITRPCLGNISASSVISELEDLLKKV